MLPAYVAGRPAATGKRKNITGRGGGGGGWALTVRRRFGNLRAGSARNHGRYDGAMKRLVSGLAGFLLWAAAAQGADTGWMQAGVRAWYFGGVDGGGSSSTDGEEAYLIKSISGTQATLVHHAATGQWTSPMAPAQTTHDLAKQGPFWIHPDVLATLRVGQHWQGLEITSVARPASTYDTLGCLKLLPALAMFEAKATRRIVRVTYMLPNESVGTAYFDGDTGLLLYRIAIWSQTKMFFVLAEINYDFAARRAFPETDRPHPGFKSAVVLQSFNGGALMVQAGVETAHKQAVEMWVQAMETGPYGQTQSANLNACFFGAVPEVRMISSSQAASRKPTTWPVQGQFLWWWIPAAALGRSQIQILDGTMPRIAGGAGTGADFRASNQPTDLYFYWARFAATGYASGLWAVDPSLGLNVGPNNAFNPSITVDGLSYYRTTMGTAVPTGVDLAVKNLAVKRPADARARSFRSCRFQIYNRGQALTAGGVRIDFYLSRDGTFGNRDDRKIGSTSYTGISIPAQTAKSFVLNSTRRAKMVRGWTRGLVGPANYHVFARAVPTTAKEVRPGDNAGRTSRRFAYTGN